MKDSHTHTTATLAVRTMPVDVHTRLMAARGLRARLTVTAHRPLSTAAYAARSLTIGARVGR